MGITAYQLTNGENHPDAPVILIQSGTTEGNVPRLATKAATLAAASRDLDKELEAVTAVANKVLAAIKKAAPGKVVIEFGVELGGKLGIPLVTEGTAKANFKVQLTWQKSEGGEGDEDEEDDPADKTEETEGEGN